MSTPFLKKFRPVFFCISTCEGGPAEGKQALVLLLFLPVFCLSAVKKLLNLLKGLADPQGLVVQAGFVACGLKKFSGDRGRKVHDMLQTSSISFYILCGFHALCLFAARSASSGNELADGLSLSGKFHLIFRHHISFSHGAVMKVKGVLCNLPAGGWNGF